MKIETVLADFAALPPQSRQETADFVAFPRRRYAVPCPGAPEPAATDLSFRGMRRGRTDLEGRRSWPSSRLVWESLPSAPSATAD